jgi:hypothetical protein
MKTLFTAILKFLAFVLAGVLIIALPVALVANNVGNVLFDQEQMKEIVTGVVLDSDLVPAALEIQTNRKATEISAKIERPNQPEGQKLNLYTLISSMEEENWEKFQDALLEDEVIGSWIQTIIDGFFNWLDTDEPIPFISLNMQPIIDRMKGPEGEAAVVAFYDSLPDCSDRTMESMQTNPGDPLPRSKMVTELCKLSTFPHADQIEVYKDVLAMVVDATPLEYNATQAVLKQREQIGGVFTLKWTIRTWRWYLDTVLLIPLLLLLLILFLGVRSMEGLGQWFGIPLIGGGLISLISAALSKTLWRGWLAEKLPEEVIPPTSLLYHELIDGTSRFIGPIFNPLIFQSFVILLIGAGLLTMGFILRMRKATGEKTS